MSGVTQRYISKELIHFVGRGLEEDEQYRLLIRIIQSGWLTHPPHSPNISGNLTVNPNAKISKNEMYSPQAICFCDIPTENLSLHVKKYGPFGLSFSKDFISKNGGSPVHYLSQKSKVRVIKRIETKDMEELLKEGKDNEAFFDHIDKGEYFDKMMFEYHDLFRMFRKMIMDNSKVAGVPQEHRRLMDLERFLSFQVFSYFKFFDHSLNDDHEDNYYFEREWRAIGNIQFSIENIRTVYLPEKYSMQFRKDLPDYYSQLIFMD
jgi:hypothetical protein